MNTTIPGPASALLFAMCPTSAMTKPKAMTPTTGAAGISPAAKTVAPCSTGPSIPQR